MRLLRSFLLTAIALFSMCYAQNDSPHVREIEERFKSFDYLEVILLSDKLLATADSLTGQDLTEIHRMRAISYYTLGDVRVSLSEFLAILRIDADYQLDPVQNSPKIISFFDEIRLNLIKNEPSAKEAAVDEKTDSQAVNNASAEKVLNNFRSAMLKSVVMPGWGHLSQGHSTKGWLLTGASLLTLGSAVYFTMESNRKEKDYLNETERALIESRYSDFNSVYKKRNLLIAAYAAIWLYAQLDLLVFSREKTRSKIVVEFPLPSLSGSLVYSVGIRYHF